MILQEELEKYDFQNYIDLFVGLLSDKSKTRPFSPVEIYPDEAGVYSVFENGELIYIGESGNLKKRIKDLRSTQNHSLRRKLGDNLFSHLHNYKPASSSEPFSVDIEIKLTKYMEENIFVLPLATNACRKEIEERAINRYKDRIMNKRGKRE